MTKIEDGLDLDYSQAACGNVENPEIFFPTGLANHWELVSEAKTYCAKCPIIAACFMHGVKHEKWGIWGGHTPPEIQAYRRRHNIVIDPIETLL